jgi:hypothetical protein
MERTLNDAGSSEKDFGMTQPVMERTSESGYLEL